MNYMDTEVKKPRAWSKIAGYMLLALVVFLLAVQYFNAARYDVLVQVVGDDKIGVNPTGERLDFGDLPHDKNAVRLVTLKNDSPYNVPSYIVVWNRGEISEFMDVSRNNFVLETGQEEKLEFTIHIPNSAELRYYYGKVVIFQIPKIW